MASDYIQGALVDCPRQLFSIHHDCDWIIKSLMAPCNSFPELFFKHLKTLKVSVSPSASSQGLQKVIHVTLQCTFI